MPQDPYIKWLIEYDRRERPLAEARYEQRERERAQAKLDRAAELNRKRVAKATAKAKRNKHILPIKPSRDYD